MRLKDLNIGRIVATSSACTVVIGIFGWLTIPRIDEKIKLETKEFVQSLDYKDSLQKAINIEIRNYIDSATFQVKLQNYLEHNRDDNVNVLALFAEKMKVSEDEVAVKLGEMYTKDRPRLVNLLIIVREKHPETNPWTIEE